MSASVFDKSFIPKNRRLDFRSARRPSDEEIQQARKCVERAGAAVKIERHLKRRSDGIAALSVEGLEVAKALVGFQQGHEMLMINATRILNSLDTDTLDVLGMPRWRYEGCYDRVNRLTSLMSNALAEGFDDVDVETGEITHIDLQWYMDAVVRASVPMEIVQGCALALDGTDMETWAVLHGGEDVDLDGEEDRPDIEHAQVSKRKAKVLGIGTDGRKIYTKDKDARAGHRSATNSRSAGKYVGRELHLGVSISASKWTDGIDRVTFGPPVPQMVLTANLVPAGTHRAKATVASVKAAKNEGFCEELVADAGYSMLKGLYFHMLLQEARIPLVMQPKAFQKTKGYFTPQSIGGAFVIDGQLFSRHTPEHLWRLERPERNAKAEDRLRSEQEFKQRAAYAYVRHKAPGDNGITRWKCPFCAGKLRSRQLPQTMRLSRTRPLVEISKRDTCCDGVVSVGADQLPMMQNAIFGTPAWAKSYHRRNLVETVNAMLKRNFTNISKGYVRSLITARIILVLAHTLAGYNRWALLSWARMQRHLAREAERPKRRKRRPNTLKQFVDFGFSLPETLHKAPVVARIDAPILT